MDLETILNDIMYDLKFKNDIVLHGNIDYITQHLGDDIVVEQTISKNQPKAIQPFVDELFNYTKENNTNISITDFYNNIWKKEN